MTASKRNVPVSLLLPERVAPVSLFVKVMAALGTTAPAGSSTVPTTVLVPCCAKAAMTMQATSATQIKKRFTIASPFYRLPLQAHWTQQDFSCYPRKLLVRRSRPPEFHLQVPRQS